MNNGELEMKSQTINTCRFNKSNEDGVLTFSKELSTLEGNGWIHGRPHQITLESEKTNQLILFVCTDVIRDADQDIAGWVYINPNFPKMTIKIWND